MHVMIERARRMLSRTNPDPFRDEALQPSMVDGVCSLGWVRRALGKAFKANCETHDAVWSRRRKSKGPGSESARLADQEGSVGIDRVEGE